MKKALSITLSVLLLLTQLFVAGQALGEENVLTAYPEYDSRITRCYDYSVSVTQGEKTENLVVYNRSNSLELLSSRTSSADNERRFCEFAFAGDEVRVDVKVNSSFSTYSVIPSSAAYRTEFNGGVLSVWIKENEKQLAIRLDDDDDTILSIFADAPENYDIDYSDSSVLVFDEKWTDPIDNNPTLKVNSNIKKIYIAPGCVLNSRLYIASDNCEVFGHGIILDPYSNVYDFDNKSSGKLVVVDAKNTYIHDVKMIDAQNFNLTYYYNSEDNVVRNVKILSARMCTDGISNYSGFNNLAENCYIYVGDNALVFSAARMGKSDAEYSFIVNNCTLGTTCAAIFPQSNLKAPAKLTNTTVFRANEGIVNVWYNTSYSQVPVEMIEFDGLDCIDCLNTPWLLNVKNMGTAEKNFRFKDVTLGEIRGSAHIADEANGNTFILQSEASDRIFTDNINVDFENLYVNGGLISDEAALIKSLPENVTDVNLSFSRSENNLLTERTVYTADYDYPAKLFIGASLQEMANEPVYEDGVWFVPYDEISTKLGVEITGSSQIINGKKMISLDELSKTAKATYNTEKSAIVIEKPKTTANLYIDNKKEDGFSRVQELVCYNTELGTVSDGDELAYRITTKGQNSAGAIVDITDEIKSYPGETFVISFDAKTTAENEQNGFFAFGKNNSINTNFINYSNITFQPEWNYYEYRCYTDYIDIDLCDLLYLIFRNNNTADFEILVKNISVKLYSEEDSPNLVINGGFERDAVPKGEWRYYCENPVGWLSTDNNTVEIGNNYWNYYIGVDQPKFIPEGRQFAEVCVEKASTLYQILETEASTRYEWGLTHVGRGDSDNTMLLVMCDAGRLESHEILKLRDWLKTQESIATPEVYAVNQYTVFANSALTSFSLSESEDCKVELSVWLLTSNRSAWVNYGSNSVAYSPVQNGTNCIPSYDTRYTTSSNECKTFFAMTNYVVKWYSTGNVIDDVHVEKIGERTPAVARAYMVDATNINSHEAETVAGVPATCTKEGVTTGSRCKVCGLILEGMEATKATGHKEMTYSEMLPASCTEDGHTAETRCASCGIVMTESEVIKSTGHSDSNSDGKCDTCGIATGETDDSGPSKNCSCNCHKSGIMGFIWKIQKIIWKLFSPNKQICVCRAKHW